MMKPLISVIIPVFNAEKRLELSIKGVLNQTYENIELILVDDGSTDSSLMICEKYSKYDQRVKVIHQLNARVSAARNRGIQEASGQFIIFMDSDDLIDTNTYEEVMKYMLDDSVDMVIFGVRFEYYKDDVLVKSKTKAIDKDIVFEVNNIKNEFFDLYDKNYLSSVWNKMIKASIIKENRILFENDMSIYEDFKFALDVLEKSQKVWALATPYYRYYNNLKSLSLKRRPNIDYTKNFQILDKRLREFSLKKGLEFEKINGMIMRYYIIAIEKLFASSASHKEKYNGMKRIILLEEFQNSLHEASFIGQRSRLKIVYYLLKKRRFRTLFLSFYLNDSVKKAVKRI